MTKLKKQQPASQKEIPAWLFFFILGILAVGAVYYIDNSGRNAGPNTPLALETSPLPPGVAPPASTLPITVAPSSPLPLPAANRATSQAESAGQPALPLKAAQRFENLPGLPLAGLSVKDKKKFLDRVNTEHCTCGCKGDTVAKCVVQDPNCQIAPAMAKRILAEVQRRQSGS